MEVVVQTPNVTILELAAEVADLRIQLAESQDQCIEMAIDAGELHAECLSGDILSDVRGL